ncbi:MAG TPA: DinB family protein [Bacteroidia bacterium]|nr:DinB family protein [Bacteroidia bacterium]
MKKYFLDLVSYNAWANRRMTELIICAGEEAATSIHKSSFPSIKETLFHIWDAEGIWLKRLKGESLDSWPSKNFIGNTFEGCEELVRGSRDFVSYVELMNESELSQMIHYTNIKGVAFSNTVTEILGHVMNHSTFHRGQIVTMLRAVDFSDLKSTDLVTFFREGNS